MGMDNDLERSWIDLLVRYGRLDECKRVIYHSKSVVFGIMKYRRILKSNGVGDIAFSELDKFLTEKDYKALHSKLEYMFLEPITTKQFDFIISGINETKNGLLKLYNRHIEDKNLRILSVIITL